MTKKVEPDGFENDDIEVRIEEDGKDVAEAVDIEGTKRDKTASEELIRQGRRKQPGASVQREETKKKEELKAKSVREQPGASLLGETAERAKGTVPNPPKGGIVPTPIGSSEDIEVRKHKIGARPVLPTSRNCRTLPFTS